MCVLPNWLYRFVSFGVPQLTESQQQELGAKYNKELSLDMSTPSYKLAKVLCQDIV